VIPIAIAVAISSVPIMTTIFILLSPNRARSGVPFLIGWVAGIVLVVSACVLLAQAVPTPRSSRAPNTVVGILEIIVGVGLVALAVLAWLRARRSTTSSTPGWLSSSGKLGPWSSLGVGLILNVRPKGLLLAIAGGLTVRADAGSLPVAVVAVVIYTLIASSTVALPIVGTLAAPKRMEPRLIATNEWMLRNGASVTSLIVVVIGLVIVGMGIARL
jgi:hypothetical protein